METLLATGLVRVRVEEWTTLSNVGGNWAAARVDRPTLALLEREALGVFAPEALLQQVATGLARADAGEIEAVLGFAATPLGRRTLRVDRAHFTPERLRREPEYLSQSMLEGMRGPRWQAFRRLDGATGMTRDTLVTAGGLGLALAANAHFLSCGSAERWPAYSARIGGRIEGLAGLVEAHVVGSLGFRFEDLPTTDVSRLVRFAEGEGAWLYQRIGEALRAAVVEASRELSRRLAPEVAARCGG